MPAPTADQDIQVLRQLADRIGAVYSAVAERRRRPAARSLLR
jgi:hypothetical protein